MFSVDLAVDAFCRYRTPLRQVESILIDRSTARSGPWILNDEDLAACLGAKFIFVVRVRMKDHRPGTTLPPADLKFALKDVPDLRENRGSAVDGARPG